MKRLQHGHTYRFRPSRSADTRDVVAADSIEDGVLAYLYSADAWSNGGEVTYYVLSDGRITEPPFGPVVDVPGDDIATIVGHLCDLAERNDGEAP